MPESWEGTRACRRPGCQNREIEGLGYCFTDVPDDLLEEAEEVTGLARMTTRRRGRGNVRPSESSASVALGNEVHERMGQVLSEHGARLVNAMPVEDPIGDLLALAGEMKAMKDLLRDRLAALNISEWRYSGTRIGEQVRAEVILYERASERLAMLLLRIVKLGLKHLRQQLRDDQIRRIDQALTKALAAAEVPLEKQAEARRALVADLRRAS